MKQGGHRPAILALVPYYRPGFKAGGPIASLEAMVGKLRGDFGWTVATSDRDYGDRQRYPSIPCDGRVVKSDQTILYLKPGLGRLVRLAWLLRRHNYDLLYINDMFSPCWGVWPLLLRRLGWLRDIPVLVAPRNQFSSGALGIKSRKKRYFLRLAKLMRFWRGLCWHATGREEEAEIRHNTGAATRVWIAPVFPNVKVDGGEPTPSSPTNAHLRLLFLSRISPKKNLEYALSLLGRLSFPVQFDIVGPADNDAYLGEIKTLMAKLPGHVSAKYLGPVEPSAARNLLTSYDALLLPTRGENFGHVILEALAAGCPLIISDRTPWKDLREKGCGWVIPLEDKEGFRLALKELNAMKPEERERMRAAARQYARAYVENPKLEELNRKMFREVLGST